MLKFYEKKSWRAALKTWWFVGLLSFVVLFLTFVVYDRFSIEREMSKRREEAEDRVYELSERKKQIEDKVEYLGSDRGMEAEMRRNFDVAQPGEQVVIILDAEKDDSNIAPLNPLPKPDTPPWYMFWR